MSKYVIAHDLGTSGNKATLFDEEGKLIAYVSIKKGIRFTLTCFIATSVRRKKKPS